MNQLAKSSLQPGPVQFTAADPVESGIRAALEDARLHAASGAAGAARMICAEIIALHQPVLERDASLLADTVATLAAARGVRSLALLLAATRGRRLRIEMTAAREATLSTSAPGRHGTECMTISEPWLADPAALRQWSEQLAGVGCDRSAKGLAARP